MIAIQKNSAVAADMPAGNEQDIAFLSDNTAGNTIIVVFLFYCSLALGFPRTFTVGDTNSNSYTLMAQTPEPWQPQGFTTQTRAYICRGINGGANTVKIIELADYGLTRIEAVILEYPASSATDGDNVASYTSVTTGDSLTTNDVTTTHATDILVSFAGDPLFSNNFSVFDAGWNLETAINDADAGLCLVVCDKAVTNTGTYNNHFIAENTDTLDADEQTGIIAFEGVAPPSGAVPTSYAFEA